LAPHVELATGFLVNQHKTSGAKEQPNQLPAAPAAHTAAAPAAAAAASPAAVPDRPLARPGKHPGIEAVFVFIGTYLL
jgi:hypothetical protein